MNYSSSYLALGIQDGSTLIWDVQYEQEAGYPDKFKNAPSCLSFVNDNLLLLSSSEN